MIKIGSIWGKVIVVVFMVSRLKFFEKCRIFILIDCFYSINDDIVLDVG